MARLPKLTNPPTQADVDLFLSRYFNDPVLFAQEILGMELDPYFQPQMMMNILEHRQFSIKGGKGAGKSKCLAAIALWWKVTRKRSKVLLMAGKVEQAKSTLFGYASEMANDCAISDWFDVTAERICIKGTSDKSLAITFGSVSPKAETGAGKHAENMLVIADEAETFEIDQWDIMIGNITEENAKIVASGNPTRLHTPFHKIFTDWKDKWFHQTVDSRKCKFVSPIWIDTFLAVYNYDMSNPNIKAKICGEFPDESLSGFVDRQTLTKCFKTRLDPKLWQELPTIMGLDVAYGGADSNVLTIRQGDHFRYIHIRRFEDNTALVLWVAQEFKQNGADKIVIDTTSGGRVIADHLRPHLPPDSIIYIDFGSSSSNKDLWANRRQELLMKMRARLQTGLDFTAIPFTTQESFADELMAMEVEFDKNGHEKVIAKSEIKARLGRSPDITDSVGLCLLHEPMRITVAAQVINSRTRTSYNYNDVSGEDTGWMA